MEAEEAANGLSGWVIAMISTLSGVFIAFLLTLCRDKIQSKNKRIQASLENHFIDIKIKTIDRIIEMSKGLNIVNGQLFFSNGSPVIPNVINSIKENEVYICFQIHFPNEEENWEELTTKALKTNKDIIRFLESHKGDNALNEANRIIETLNNEFTAFSHKLHGKSYDIEYYQMEKFKKNKKCPICRKF